MKHTPGPWRVELGESACFHRGNRAAIVHDVGEGADATAPTIAEVWPASDGSDFADARLIAAAPELLTWISNVATDAQLDTPVPALDGMTGRTLLTRIEGRNPRIDGRNRQPRAADRVK